MYKDHFGHILFLANHWLENVITFKILNWKPLRKVADEVDILFRKALETVVLSRLNFSFHLEKTS